MKMPPVKRIIALGALSPLLTGCLSDDQSSLISNGGSAPVGSSEAVSGAPSARANGPSSVAEADELVLTGAASPSSGRSIRLLTWGQIEQDEIRAFLPADSTGSELRFKAPQVETDTLLTFRFTAQDNTGATASDLVQVMVKNTLPNRLPIASPGADQVVGNAVESIELNGCNSRDPDGQIVQFNWKELGGSGQVPFSANTCKVSAPLNRADSTDVQYTFQLTVIDDKGAASIPRTVKITQRKSDKNTKPELSSVSVTPTPAYPGEEITLTASATDAEGHPIHYEWTQVGGPPAGLRDSQQQTARAIAPELPPNADSVSLSFKVTAVDGGTSAQNASARVLDVTVAKQPKPAGFNVMSCIQNPTQTGCFSGIRHLLFSNASPNSAGQCNPKTHLDWSHHWGALHEHTAYSDGTALTRPFDVYRRVQSKGLDFAISTDHSDNIGLPIPVTIADDPAFCATSPLACVLSDPNDIQSNFSKWESTLAQANQASGPQFTAIRGFEWTSDRFGHANVLMSRNNINAKTGPGYLVSMEAFWAWFLAPSSLGGGDDGLIVFNHPGREDAIHGALLQLGEGIGNASRMTEALNALNVFQQGDPAYAFNDFRYIPAADYRTVGIEVFGKGDEYDTDGKKGSWFAHALDKGWYLAPAGSEDHHGTEWGQANLPKTVLIARSKSQSDLREAMTARRMYAVAQNYNDLKLEFYADHGNGKQHMGSRIVSTSDSLGFEVAVSPRPGRPAPYDLKNTTIEVFSSVRNNTGGYAPLQVLQGSSGKFRLSNSNEQQWVFVRVKDLAMNRIVAVSAPIWFKAGTAPLPTCQ